MKLSKVFCLFTLVVFLFSCKNGTSENENKPLVPDPDTKVQLNTIIAPTTKKVTNQYNRDISKESLDSYIAFAKKFSLLMLENNNAENEKSMGISIPDAYSAFATLAAISTDEARKDILDYLELPDMDALSKAVKEVLFTLGTLKEIEENKYMGGYNLNSIWMNPKKVQLLEDKDEQLYTDLDEIFDSYLFNEALTSAKANDFLKAYGLKNLPTPKVVLDDSDPVALSIMSVYYCIDYFEEYLQERYKSEYKTGTHKINYKVNEEVSKVDYIEQRKHDIVYEGENFNGATLDISGLEMAFFLPNDENALPSSILFDVINEEWKPKVGQLKSFCLTDDGEEYDIEYEDTTNFIVTVKAPYFYIDSAPKLEKEILKTIFPNITKDGAGRRLVDPLDEYGQVDKNYRIFMKELLQFSIMKFNYEGFYSCSVTVIENESEGSALPERYYKEPEFILELNHPYIFEVRRKLWLDGSTAINVPIVIGEIVNPDYKD